MARGYRSDLGMGDGTSHLEGHLQVSRSQVGGVHCARDTPRAGQRPATLLPELSHRKCLLSTDDSHYTSLLRASLVLYSQLCGLATVGKANI